MSEAIKSKKIKRMAIKEFVTKGYLQEVNRQFFHPLGLALEVQVDDNNKYFLSGIWDYRKDKEGTIFVTLEGKDKYQRALRIKRERDLKMEHRWKKLGFKLQPIRINGKVVQLI